MRLTLAVLVLGGLSCGSASSLDGGADAGLRASGNYDGGLCPGAGVTVATPGLCSCDGTQQWTCGDGQVCPTSAHGHSSVCCSTPANPCQRDADCCNSTVCLGSGGCSKGRAAYAGCFADADCAGGHCDTQAGTCTALAVGAACQAQGVCANGLCTNGVCACLPSGTGLAPGESFLHCCARVSGGLPDGGLGCG